MTHATLIANAGILLEIDGIRFLIDGLHHSSQYPFSPVPQAMLDQMLRGEGPFRDADFLLFTHDHPDHWSPALTQAYLQANRVRRVLLPPRSKDGPAQDALTADISRGGRQTCTVDSATRICWRRRSISRRCLPPTRGRCSPIGTASACC